MEDNKFLSVSEKYYLKFSELLGVKIFKKYWHVRGFFNENNKLDKNNKFHLNYVIRDANDFTNQHKSGIVSELIMLYIPITCYGIYDLIMNKKKDLLVYGLSISSYSKYV